MSATPDSAPPPPARDLAGASSEALRERLASLESEVTRARELEALLRRSEERFRRIFDHANDAIFLVDLESDQILDVNASACRMLGFAREELLSLPMSAIHPHEMEAVRAFAARVVEEGSGFTSELSCLTKVGRYVAAEISGAVAEFEGRPCMIAAVRDVSDRDRLQRELDYLTREMRGELRHGSIVGNSEGIRQVLEQVERVAPTEASVLISGESGTGKELVAREIHERSPRREHALVRVNCAAIPADLFESEFFGHVKGAFTGAVADRTGRFQLADGGTLFLDEVGEIPLELQAKLLRVLQEGQLERVGDGRTLAVDVRIVAATNRDLRAEADAGRFRQDLYYRLGVFPIAVPALRERPVDIAPIARHLVELICRRLGRPVPEIDPPFLRALEAHDWPGNVRELSNVLERAVILARRGRLRFDPSALLAGDSSAGAPPAPRLDLARLTPTDLDALEDLGLAGIARLERAVIERALERSQGKVYGPGGAAERLGLRPSTLASRLKKMGLQRRGGLSGEPA